MIKLYFDGACDQGECAGYGFYVKDNDEWLVTDYGPIEKKPSRITSNLAEHYALYMGLLWLLENGFAGEKILVAGDSKMVISQMFRGWKCKNSSAPYAHYYYKNVDILSNFKNVKGRLLPRKYNAEADRLSKLGKIISRKKYESRRSEKK